VTLCGRHPREFSHSLKYKHYFSRRHTYFRLPYHLNPILRSVAPQFPFRAVSYSDDAEWRCDFSAPAHSSARREEFIDTPLYFFDRDAGGAIN